MNRRGFIAGLSALLVAPSIVRAGSIMPVSVAEKPFTAVIGAGQVGMIRSEWGSIAIDNATPPFILEERLSAMFTKAIGEMERAADRLRRALE